MSDNLEHLGSETKYISFYREPCNSYLILLVPIIIQVWCDLGSCIKSKSETLEALEAKSVQKKRKFTLAVAIEYLSLNTAFNP